MPNDPTNEATPTKHFGEWTSVNDQLPAQARYTGHVLVARTLPEDPRFGDRDVSMGYLALTGWRDDHHLFETIDAEVTHWMPFPDLPEKMPAPAPPPAPPATLRVTDERVEGMRVRMREVGVQDLLADRAEMVKELARLRDEAEALSKFKAYVHRRLDEAGVPTDPESPHKGQGCRIGGRLDIVLGVYAEGTKQ